MISVVVAALSVLFSLFGIYFHIKQLWHKEDSQQIGAAYANLPLSADDMHKKHENLLFPRMYVWLQQICILSSILCICREVFTSCLLNLVCYINYSSTFIIATSYIISLGCDPLGKISRNWKAKSVWIPAYSMNALFLMLLAKTESNDLISPTILAAIFAISALVFSIIVAIEHKPITLKNPPPEEFTVGLFSFMTFSYINKEIVAVRNKKESLELDDVPGIIDRDTCKVISKVLHSLIDSVSIAYFELCTFEKYNESV
jgi:hypothetical protein